MILGAQLDLGGLIDHPAMLALTGALVGLNVLIHLAAAAIGRLPAERRAGRQRTARRARRRRVAGARRGRALGPIATAIVASSLVSLGVCTAGVGLLLAREGSPTRTLAP